LLWCSVAFALFDGGLARERFRGVERDFSAGRSLALEVAVRAYVTNDGDIHRYFAYAQAARGHPYQSYFVRTSEAWTQAFGAAEPYRPDDWPVVTPPRALVPYRDYLVEYPPGFFAAVFPPAWFAHDDPDVYVKVFQAFMAALLTVAFVLATITVHRLGGVALGSALGWAALATLLLGVVSTHRYDAAVAVALSASLFSLAAGNPLVCGISLGVAIALKGMPAIILPVVAMYLVREGRRRALGVMSSAAALTLVMMLLPVELTGGRLSEIVRYHALRPVEIESTWAAILGLVHVVAPGAVVIEKTFGSANVGGLLGALAAKISTVATALGLLGVYVRTWRRLANPPDADDGHAARFRIALEASVASLAVFIALGKVCSPQYLVWVVPFGLALSLREGQRSLLALLLVVLALTQVIYPILFAQLGALRVGVCVVVLVRNGLLLVWASMLQGSPRSVALGTPSGDLRTSRMPALS
jgi:hypothetical protein